MWNVIPQIVIQFSIKLCSIMEIKFGHILQILMTSPLKKPQKLTQKLISQNPLISRYKLFAKSDFPIFGHQIISFLATTLKIVV